MLILGVAFKATSFVVAMAHVGLTPELDGRRLREPRDSVGLLSALLAFSFRNLKLAVLGTEAVICLLGVIEW